MDGTALTTISQVLISGLAVGSVYALVALGFNVTFVVNGTLNMGQGHAVMLGGMLMFTFMEVLHLRFLAALVLVTITVGFYGALVELVAVRRFAREVTSVTWLLSTLAIAIIIEDVALYYWGPINRRVPSPVGEGFAQVFGATVFWKELLLIPAVVLILTFLYIFYVRSHWGLWLRAAADNRVAIKLMGVNNNFLVMLAFGISGSLAGLAGGLYAPVFTVFPAMGLPIALTAVAVAIVAGLNSTKGIVFTGFALGLLQVMVSRFISPDFRDSLIYLLVLAVLFIKPTGIFGRRAPVHV